MTRLALCLLLLLAGCADSGPARRPVVVLAAASLTAPLTAVAESYEQAHGDVDLRLSFAGSQVLAAQVREGVPADLLVTADVETYDSVRELLEPPVAVAGNALAIVTATDNPLGIRTLRDLGRPGLRVVLAGPSVPVGRAARRALARDGTEVRSLSDEPDVGAVVARVRLGEADAGIAYVTDLRGPEVDGVRLPGTETAYAAGLLRDAGHADDARALLDHLLGPAGQAELAAFGLLPPP